MKKVLSKLKKFNSRILQVLKLPQCVAVLILVIISVISIIFSKITYNTIPFLSSVLSNVFAGLITGIAICLITGVKSMVNYNTERKISFLKDLHEECLKFIKMYREMISKANRNANSDEDLFDCIYDVLCQGNNIDCIISQSQFDKTNSFNPYKFFKRELNYDSVEHSDSNNALRDNVLLIDGTTISGKELVELFSEMEKSVFNLNVQILDKIKEYEIRQTLSQKTIF